jgi:hypothetical protein
MAFISKKKLVYTIKEPLRDYLINQAREVSLPITYEELHRFDNAIPFIDNHGKDTLWETVLHSHQVKWDMCMKRLKRSMHCSSHPEMFQ